MSQTDPAAVRAAERLEYGYSWTGPDVLLDALSDARRVARAYLAVALADSAAVRAACERLTDAHKCPFENLYDPSEIESLLHDGYEVATAYLAATPAPASPIDILPDGWSSDFPAHASPAAGERSIGNAGPDYWIVFGPDRKVIADGLKYADADLLAHGHVRLAALERERDAADQLADLILAYQEAIDSQPSGSSHPKRVYHQMCAAAIAHRNTRATLAAGGAEGSP